MLKFTALLSDEFRQSASFSSSKAYQEIKNPPRSFHQQSRQAADISFRNVKINKPHLSYESTVRKQMVQPERSRGFSQTHHRFATIQSGQMNGNERTPHRRMRTEATSFNPQQMKNYPTEINHQYTQAKRPRQPFHSVNFQSDGRALRQKVQNIERAHFHHKPQLRMKETRLNNLQNIQRRIEETLNNRIRPPCDAF